MQNNKDRLEQAVNAFCRQDVPAGPSNDLIRQTLERIEQKRPNPFVERIFSMKSMSKFAAAAIILAGVSMLFLFNSGPSSVALADVYAKVQQARAFMYKVSLTMTGSFAEGQPESTSTSEGTVMISGEHGMKTDIITLTNGSTIHQQMYMVPRKQLIVSVLPEQKKVLRMEFSEELAERLKKQNNDPRQMIAQMLSCEYSDLGQSELNGVRVQGFQTSDPAYLAGMSSEGINVTLWVDVKTWLPHYSEMEFTMGSLKTHMEQHDFQWTISAGADDFTPPSDYEVIGNVKMPAANEETALSGLRKFWELTGAYPAKLDSMSLMMEAMKAIEQRPEIQELKKNKELNARELTERLMQEMLPMQATAEFYGKQVQEQRDPAYYGDQVTPQDTDAVLMRWKTDGGKYKVIFGDLSAVEMAYEDMIKIEPAAEPNTP